jgi:hypothetical protein
MWFEISKFESSKIQAFKILTLFTIATKLISGLTSATTLASDMVSTLVTRVQHIILAWDMLPILTTRVQHLTSLLAYHSSRSAIFTQFTLVTTENTM